MYTRLLPDYTSSSKLLCHQSHAANPARRSGAPACKQHIPSGIFKLRLSCVPLNERLQHLATEPGRLLLPLAAMLFTAVSLPIHTKGTVHSAGCNAAHVGTDRPLLSSLLCKDIDGCAIAALPLQQCKSGTVDNLKLFNTVLVAMQPMHCPLLSSLLRKGIKARAPAAVGASQQHLANRKLSIILLASLHPTIVPVAHSLSSL